MSKKHIRFLRQFIGLSGCAVALLSLVHALHWTSVEAVLRPLADGAMPVASYGFRNDASAPVMITQAVPSCDCTTVELTKKTYAPGESGVLVARFDPTGRSGDGEPHDQCHDRRARRNAPDPQAHGGIARGADPHAA
ncbi:MAG: DUF1573 domain-containing protein [Undibacterium sp.]|nr:DUF1573 domain-containing protein [Opitutaceae bacterium]